ncbi:MAG: hypothetical protein QOG03_85 [Actinomycetota bacterium]|nr:hypothetical protein [Actinomycetota bacterium]
MRLSRLIAVGAAVALVPTTAGLTRLAHPTKATATPGGAVVTAGFTFAPPAVAIAQGTALTHVNSDVAPHNVVADALGADGQPLFASPVISSGQTATVDGVDKLAPAAYTFHCALHSFMTGTLNVQASPAPIPSVDPGTLTGVSVAGSVPTPTAVTLGPDHALYVTSYGPGAVYRLPILAGGLLGPGAVYATGFSSPLGLTFGSDGTLFVSDSHAATFDDGHTTAGRVWAVPAPVAGATTGGTPDMVLDLLPNGRHNTNGLRVHNGMLYVTNGSSTDDGTSSPGETPLTGALIAVPEGTRHLDVAADGSNITFVMQGGRNLYDVAFRPGTDDAWVPMNGNDNIPNVGQDALLKVAGVGQPGFVAADFGFPRCLWAADATDGHPVAVQNPNYDPATDDAHSCAAHPAQAPETLYGMHVSADGSDWGPNDSFWKGDLFTAEFGSFFSTVPTGHKVVRVHIDPATGKAGAPEDFLVGPSPLGLAFGPDGLYIADFGTGQISLVKGS